MPADSHPQSVADQHAEQGRDDDKSLPEPARGPAHDVPTFVDLVDGERTCMMTTVDTDGGLHARPMAVQAVDDDGTVWFLAYSDSEKIGHLAADPHVNLSFAPGGSWVSVSGTGTTLDDLAKKRELWNRYAQAWFQREVDDPDVVVVRVDPSGGEYWEAPDKPVQAVGLVRTMVAGTRPPEGENAKLDLG